MSKNNKLDLLNSGLLFYLVLGLGAGSGNAAELGAELRAGYSTTDNIFLTAVDETSDSIWTAGMTFNLFEQTNKMLAEVEAVADYLDYDDSFDSEVIGALDIRLDYAFADEYFVWTIQENYGQRLTDPLSSPNPGNRENINFFSTGPNMQVPMGSRAFIDLEGRYSSITFEESLSDNDRTSGRLGIARRSNEQTTLGFNVSTERVHFSDSAFRADFDIHEAFVSYDLTSTRNIISFDVGYTELEVDVSSENNTSDGNLIRASWTRVSTELSTFTFSGGSEYSTREDIFRLSQRNDTEIGGTVDVNRDEAPFRRNFFNAQYDLTGDRTRIAVELDWNQDDYTYITPVVAPQDRDIHGLRLFVERDLNRSYFVNFDALISNRDYKYIDREDDDLVLRATLGYRVSDSFNIVVSYRYLDRDSDDAAEGFTENRASLGVTYVPRWAR